MDASSSRARALQAAADRDELTQPLQPDAVRDLDSRGRQHCHSTLPLAVVFRLSLGIYAAILLPSLSRSARMAALPMANYLDGAELRAAVARQPDLGPPTGRGRRGLAARRRELEALE
jgi:hypothetical protein